MSRSPLSSALPGTCDERARSFPMGERHARSLAIPRARWLSSLRELGCAALLVACGAQSADDHVGAQRGFDRPRSLLADRDAAAADGWQEIARGGGSGTSSLELRVDDDALRVRIGGDALSSRYQLFIDADGDPTTGVQLGGWAQSGAEFMVENGRLYPIASDRTWFDPTARGEVLPSEPGSAEIAIAKADLPGLSADFGIAYAELPEDGGFEPLSRLPADSFYRPSQRAPVEPDDRTDPEAVRDWTLIAREPDGAGASALLLAHDQETIVLKVEGRELSDHYEVHIDADGDHETGIQVGSWEATGVDYLVLDGFLHPTSEARGWTDPDVKGVPIVRRAVTDGVELLLPRSAMKRLRSDARIGLGYLELPADGSSREPTKVLPKIDFYRPRPNFEGSGLIIPAYFTADQPEAWERLAALSASTRGAGSDLWVAINGDDNGPFRDPDAAIERAKLERVRPAWQAIDDSGLTTEEARAARVDRDAKVFGYIHTCRDPKCDLGLVPLAEVASHVDKWIDHYPDLDGIWIDEFYPQRDTATSKPGPQWDPRGGHYEQLTSYIREQGRKRLGRELLLIGNAGGRLYSDRLRYAQLVDVICTFEAAYDKLEFVPAQGGDPRWPGIARQHVTPRRGQLALIHNVPDEDTMRDVVERALKEGYSHVYVTDGILEDETLWRGLPSYLGTQASMLVR